MAADGTAGIETALTTLQPIRDLAKNWDIDIAAWCVFPFFFVAHQSVDIK